MRVIIANYRHAFFPPIFMLLSELITSIAAFVFLSTDFKLENIVAHLNSCRYAIFVVDSSQPILKGKLYKKQ